MLQTKENKMNWESPEWYLTPQEFADLVVQSLEDTNHWKKNERAHPEDIVVAFTTQAEAIAIGAGAIVRKVSANNINQKKNGVMQTGNLRKDALPQDDEIARPTQEGGLGYSEYRHKNAYM
jgi:hypothetical protein